MFAYGKNKELLTKLENYLNIVRDTVDVFREAVEYYLEHGLDEHFEVLAQKTHRFESNADDVRRSIETEMFKKSLLPESRKDLLTIIELIDRIPNCAETITNMFITQKVMPIDEIKNSIVELLELSAETTSYVLEATLNCFGKMDRVAEFNRLVDDNETTGDALERHMITKVFNTTLDTGEKILQRDLILQCGNICDLCEHAIDIIVITSIKRQV